MNFMPILIYFKKQVFQNRKAQSTIEYFAILLVVTIITILMFLNGSNGLGVNLVLNVSNSSAHIADKASEVLSNQDKFFGWGDPFDYNDAHQYPEPHGSYQ